MTSVPCSLEMCRCCGGIAEPNDLLQFERAEQVKRELMECWKIQIRDDDELPDHICQLCCTKVEDYLNFRQKCINLQDELKTLYKNFKSVIRRISIAKKSCVENSQRTENDLAATHEINIDTAPKRIIIKGFELEKVNVGKANKNLIPTLKQNQSFEGKDDRFLLNKSNTANYLKRANATQIQNLCQYPKVIVKRLVQDKTNVASAIQNNEKTKRKQNLFSQETAKKFVNNKTNADNIVKNVNTEEKQTLNVTAKDAVEFVVFPDIEYSKETISQTYIRDVTKHNTDTSNDPLDETDIDIIIAESMRHEQDCKLIEEGSKISQSKDVIKHKTDANNDPLDETDNDIIITESKPNEPDCKLVEKESKNMLSIEETTTEVERFFDDISQSKDVIKHKTDANNDPIDETDNDIIITESKPNEPDCKHVEKESENMLSIEETTTEVEHFFDEISQTTTDTPEPEWRKPCQNVLKDFDRKHLIKEIEDPLDESLPWACKFCISDSEQPIIHSEIFYTKAELIEHILLTHNAKYPYKCQLCTRIFISSQRCVFHIIHTHKQHGVICIECGIGSGPYRNFEQHKKRFHSFGNYECETCGKKFINKSLAKFDYHKRWHNKNRQLQCSYCAKIFVQSTHLIAHEMIHTKNYALNCEICGKGFTTQLNKGLHKHIIHGCEKPIKCLHCDKRFKCYSTRFTHMEEMHGYVANTSYDNVKCVKCKKIFKREANYRKHIQTDCLNIKDNKSFQQPDKKFPCDQCSCRFRTQPGLKQHIVLHSKEGRPFECHICHLNYKSNSNLETHNKLKHNPNKPFQCDICGKSFHLKNVLNGHRQWHKIKISDNERSVEPHGDDNLLVIDVGTMT